MDKQFLHRQINIVLSLNDFCDRPPNSKTHRPKYFRLLMYSGSHFIYPNTLTIIGYGNISTAITVHNGQYYVPHCKLTQNNYLFNFYLPTLCLYTFISNNLNGHTLPNNLQLYHTNYIDIINRAYIVFVRITLNNIIKWRVTLLEK